MAESADKFVARLLKELVALPAEKDPMPDILAAVGRCVGADRSYLCYFYGVEASVGCSCTYEWCAEGVEPVLGCGKACECPHAREIYQAFAKGRDFPLADTACANARSGAWFAQRGVRSLIASSVRARGGAVIGLLGFDFIRTRQKAFSEDLKQLIREVADIISVCRERRMAIRKANDAETVLWAMLDTLPNCIWVLDADEDFRFVMGNLAYRRQVPPGGERAQAPGGSGLLPPCQREAFLAHLHEVRQAGRPATFDAAQYVWDGHSYEYVCQETLYVAPDGRRHIFCVAREVSAARRRSRADCLCNDLLRLAVSQSEPRRIVEGVLAAVLRNETVCAVSLCTARGQVLCSQVRKGHVLPPETSVGARRLAWRARLAQEGPVLLGETAGATSGRMVAIEVRYPGARMFLVLELCFAEERCFDDSYRQAFERIRDALVRLSEHVHRYRQLAVARRMVQREIRAREDFFASVSHDIRTPLNAVLGFSELLKGEPDPQVRARYIDNITFSGNMLLELTNDILDLARLDAGKMVFRKGPVDLQKQAELLLQTFQGAVQEKGLDLRLRMDGLPRIVELDEYRARQVLFNLVGNAVKYTDRGWVEVTLAFDRKTATLGALRLSVRDTGIGIAEQDIPRLMNPYVRIQAVNARGGTGLGLSIARRIVETMGGHVSIVSALGEGSTFTVTVPGVAYRDSEAPAADRKASVSVDKADAGRTDFSRLHLLVVDDLEMNRKVLAASCRRLGVQRIEQAASAEEALHILRTSEDPFCLVLTDMKMPGVDGGGFIRAVRADPRFADLTIYLVTADVEASKYAQEIGASGLLIKPVLQNSLAAALATACAAARRARAAKGISN